MNVPECPRVLITRLSAVGDCIHTMPLVGALRAAYPQAFIAWAVQRGPASLLADYPGLDKVIEVSRDWLTSPSQIWRLRRQLRSLRFDLAIDPQSLTKSSMLGWLSGARTRIGFAAPQGRELSVWLNSTRVQPKADHVVDRYLQLLEPLGGGVREARFELPVRSFAAIEQRLEALEFQGTFAVINPGAGWDSKLWCAHRFARVARHLGRQHQMPTIVVWAGQRELRWAKTIVAESDGCAHLAPDTSLQELTEVLRAARLCIASDTGPLHLAAAVGTPCIGLYGTTQPHVCGPYGEGHRSIQAYYHDGCARERRQASNDAMMAIQVDDVTAVCDELLADHEQQAA